jgi:hypothetical protein
MAITRRGVFVSGSAIAALSTLYDAHGTDDYRQHRSHCDLVVVGSWVVGKPYLTGLRKVCP